MSLDFSLYDGENELFSANITHNLGAMAREAGIYMALWRPEEIDATKAKQVYPILAEGLMKLVGEPSHYKQFDAPNGWGKWEHFIRFVAEVTEACRDYPEATIHASR